MSPRRAPAWLIALLVTATAGPGQAQPEPTPQPEPRPAQPTGDDGDQATPPPDRDQPPVPTPGDGDGNGDGNGDGDGDGDGSGDGDGDGDGNGDRDQKETCSARRSEIEPGSWEITGNMVDPESLIRSMLEPVMRAPGELTPVCRQQIVDACERIGYHGELSVRRRASGREVAVLDLDPIVVVRWVDVKMRQSLTDVLLDDEVRRRLRLRPGAPLPWDGGERQALIKDESDRVQSFLRDSGFFEAVVVIQVSRVGAYGARVVVQVDLGPRYKLGKVTVVNTSQTSGDLAVSNREIAGVFDPGRWCFFSRCRFTRARLQADLDDLVALIQRRGYPGVRVSSDFDPLTSFDRRSREVDLELSIDERRKLDVVFEGNDRNQFPDDVLARELTFAGAGAADDVEVEASARALQSHYQSRGYFDAVVTSERVRLGSFDRVVYRIEPGQQRSVYQVAIRCRAADRTDVCSLPEGDLRDAIGTRTTERSLFGEPVFPTSDRLSADVEALTRYYRERGFLDAQVRVEVAPTDTGWSAAAVAAALVAARHRPRSLAIRLVVDEGPRTVIDRIEVVLDGTGDTPAADPAQVRAQIDVADGDPYVPDKLTAAARKVESWYWDLGRPRAKVTVGEAQPIDGGHRVRVKLTVDEGHELRVGAVMVRGNFRTRDWVVREELGFSPGQRLTGQLYTAGPRRVRGTNLFSSVSLDLIGFDVPGQDTVSTVVRVVERNDALAQLDLEAGYSRQSSLFARAKPSLPNLWGVGVRADFGFTLGTQYQAAEGSLRLPRWLAHHAIGARLDTELSAYLRNQSTERFGDLLTAGASVAASRAWERPRGDGHSARVITAALRYDFRRRSRDEELVRPAGLAGDLTTNPIQTYTGTVGVTLTWDQRHDASGNLNPLAPDAGFRLEAGAAVASPYLLGQDTFVKLDGLAQVFWTRGRFQLRVDARYDHGIPLAGAVLLPEVERFFAGGDNTVRGFEEDRLATEIVEEPVPPLGQTTQLRVLPAGGNIRALATIDAQVRVWKLWSFPVASAIFTDAGLVTNTLVTVGIDDIRPAVGSAVRLLLPVGAVSLEYAVPLFPRLGDNPRGRTHLVVALRY